MSIIYTKRKKMFYATKLQFIIIFFRYFKKVFNISIFIFCEIKINVIHTA